MKMIYTHNVEGIIISTGDLDNLNSESEEQYRIPKGAPNIDFTICCFQKARSLATHIRRNGYDGIVNGTDEDLGNGVRRYRGTPIVKEKNAREREPILEQE